MTRQKKVIRVLTGILAVIVIGCFSVYLKPLDKMKEEQKLNEFEYQLSMPAIIGIKFLQ